MMMLLPLLAFAAMPQTAASAAPETCAAIDADLKPPFAGWATTGTGMAMDRAFQLPAQNGAASASFAITDPGRYRIALDQSGWIDLLRDGKPLESVGHGHGPDCSTIRKVVDFDLTPGRYTLRLTKLTRASAKTMIIKPVAP